MFNKYPIQMKIDHLAIWVEDLEIVREFYCSFFNMKSSEKYVNARKKFSSYFLTFGDGCRLEIMHQSREIRIFRRSSNMAGLAHFAISVGSRDEVDRMTEKLRKADYIIHGEPRVTGDGYYESVVLDPEGNQVEITE